APVGLPPRTLIQSGGCCQAPCRGAFPTLSCEHVSSACFSAVGFLLSGTYRLLAGNNAERGCNGSPLEFFCPAQGKAAWLRLAAGILHQRGVVPARAGTGLPAPVALRRLHLPSAASRRLLHV